jgi:hypothetical protein
MVIQSVFICDIEITKQICQRFLSYSYYVIIIPVTEERFNGIRYGYDFNIGNNNRYISDQRQAK